MNQDATLADLVTSNGWGRSRQRSSHAGQLHRFFWWLLSRFGSTHLRIRDQRARDRPDVMVLNMFIVLGEKVAWTALLELIRSIDATYRPPGTN